MLEEHMQALLLDRVDQQQRMMSPNQNLELFQLVS
jgi:hypothetical protein